METTANGIGIPNFPIQLPATHMEPDVLETLFLSQYSLTDNSRRLVQTSDNRNQSDENDIGASDSHSYVNQEPEPEDDYDNGDSHSYVKQEPEPEDEYDDGDSHSYVKQEPASENDNGDSHCFSHPSCFNIQVSPACNMRLVIMFTCTISKMKIFYLGKLDHILSYYAKMVLACMYTPVFSEVKAFFGVVRGGSWRGRTRRLFPLTRSRGWSWQ